MELVHVVARCLVLGAVDGNSVPHLILHDQHTELFELLAQLLDVIADEAVVDIHIRSVIEDVQRAVNIDFKGSCDALCLRLLLISQNVVEVFEDRHFLRLGVCKKLLIDHADTAVNDGLLNRLQAVLAADNQLAHGENEVGFQRQRVFLFGVVRVDVQRIDVIRADWRDADDLTAELLHKGEILGFGVADDDVILRDEEGIRHFALCGEGFAGTGRTQDQPVGVLELLAVNHDHVVGQCVQPVVESFAALKKLLRGERHENRRAGSGQSAFDFHLIDADRQRGHQPFLLLEVETLERTVILLGNGGGLEHRVFELLAVGCRVHDEDGHEEQSLIAGLEILQQTLCLTAEGGEIGRDDVHIVAGADCLFLLFNLHLVEVGDLHLDALDCLRLVNRPDMKIDRDVAVHLKEVGKHTVIEFRREDLQEAHRTDGFAHLEALAFTEVKGSGSDEILAGKPRPGNHVKGKAERLIAVHIEHIMKHFQPFVAGQRLGSHAESFEVVEDVGFNAFELRLCRAEGVRLNAEGDVLLLDQPVVALGELALQHSGILGANVVEGVLLCRNVDALAELIEACLLIDEGELDENRAIKVVQKVTPVLKDGSFVLVLRKLVVDVLKGDGLRVEAAVYLADTVAAHLHIGNGLLGGLADFLCLPVLFLLHDDPLLFLSGKGIAVNDAVFDGHLRLCLCCAVVQAAIPPVL